MSLPMPAPSTPPPPPDRFPLVTVVEQPLPPGVPVLVERSVGGFVLRADRAQICLTLEQRRSDLRTIRRLFPQLAPLADRLDEVYVRQMVAA